ncbi:MAG: sigma-70 family RNA polymerase sigma factor [Novosphingobium sp.]
MNASEAERSALLAAMHRLRAGEQAALAEIYRATSAKLFGICLRILQDSGEAEDALQEVYVGLWRNAARFDESRASPIAWLATFARNRAIDRLRMRGRAGTDAPIEAAGELADPSPLADIALEAGEDSLRIHHCLSLLEARQSSAIGAAFLDGTSYPELATRAGVPLGTMKSWIRRGLARLKECLER